VENKAASGGCCGSTCPESLFFGMVAKDGFMYHVFNRPLGEFNRAYAYGELPPLQDEDGRTRVQCLYTL